MQASRNHASVQVFFLTAFVLNALFAAQAWHLKSRWLNVPPVPGDHVASMAGLADTELAYRLMGIMLQNLGDSGGRTTPLIEYDYKRLRQWFVLSHALSPRSDSFPYLASFYFGSVRDPEKSKELVEYLREEGRSPYPGSWRWTAQAVYLARYHVKDLELAYELATELANHNDPRLPYWAKQMPAFILNERGEKEAAYDLLVGIMSSGVDTLPPEELNALRDYVCKRILTRKEAESDPLCAE